MKMEMTERDKKLLVMLSVFVIVVCIGYWGIYPVMKDMKKIGNEIDSQKEEQEINELKMSMLPMLEAENEQMEDEIVKAREKYFPLMTNAEIDKYFTAMALTYSLQAYDLSISNGTDEASLDAYQYSEKYMQQQAENQPEAVGEGQTQPLFTDSEGGETGIYSATVTLRLGGDETKLKKLIDDLSEDTKLRVCGFQWSNDRSVVVNNETEDYEVITTKVLNLTLEIYMYEE